MLPAALVVAAYLLGSIPFSFLVVKLVAGADIRQHGSRNVGATNVARSFGKLPGVVALLLDVAKGRVGRPEWAAPLRSTAFWVTLAAVIAVLAHMFPVWLKFHGGKGVATATGAFLAIDPKALGAGVIIFVIVIVATRIVSLASILSAASIPIFLRFLTHAPFWTVVLSIVISIAIIVKHHSNIARLAQGTERKMGQRK